MPLKKIFLLLLFAGAVLCSSPAHADKSTAAIQAPERAPAGSTIPIRIVVTHSGNNILHYTQWVRVTVNGTEVARWDFSWKARPEAAVFTRDITYTVKEPLNIEAEASCNIHGSKGIARATVAVTGKDTGQ